VARFAVRAATASLVLVAVSAGTSVARVDLPTAPFMTSDFNGDGRSDLAISAPGWPYAGSVNVLYANANGLSESNDQLWSQGSTNINGAPETGDEFGRATAHADFDNDGYDDLAIGVPAEDGADTDQGAVNVIYGTSTRLSAAGDQLWTLDSTSVVGTANGNEQFGQALAAGDFNGDGNADLAIGSNGLSGAGAVNVLYGAAGGGLQASNDQQWTQASAGIPGGSENGDRFGAGLAVGNFNGDGFWDLAIGAPGENSSSGVVHVLYGSASGLASAGTQLWSQDSSGVSGGSESGDRFGLEMAGGDFNGDGRSDLAIGVPGEFLAGFPSDEDASPHGAVNVLYGSGAGLATTGQQQWTQASPGILGQPNDGPDSIGGHGDYFGAALVAGDFNGDTRADLAVGSPFDGYGGVAISGAVNVIYGSASGLAAAGNQIWTQASAGVADSPNLEDRFGCALGTGYFNADVYADLAVGAPVDYLGTSNSVGGVHVLKGSASGLTSTGSQLWWRGVLGVLGTQQDSDYFGADLGEGNSCDFL
jgi:hypothetical protein